MLQRASSLQRPPGPVPTISQSRATIMVELKHGEFLPLAGGLVSEKPLSTSQFSLRGFKVPAEVDKGPDVQVSKTGGLL